MCHLPRRSCYQTVAACLTALAWLSVLCQSPALAAEPLGKLDFELPGSEGEAVRLSADPAVELHVVCFLGTECPLARLYGPRLQRLADRFPRRVSFVGIVPNQQDSIAEIRQYRQQHGIRFPVAKDYDQRVTQSFGATRTPEVFVLDRSAVIRYQGRIDDQYQPGIARNAPTTHDLTAAIEQLLDGQPVDVPQTTAVGCRIAPRRIPDANSSVTFTDQVSRVLNRNCVECHREGEIGPFALTDYDEVVGWADMMLEVIDNGRMPPWHAAGDQQAFKNARQMSDADRQILHDWVEAGTPYGEAGQLPEPPPKVSGWRLPTEPDEVFAMSDRAYQVPAEGTVEYQYFVVDPGYETDRWVSAAEVIPGNPSVVHHCIVFVRPPDGGNMREIGFLSGYVPGQDPMVLPEGYARRVRAGSHFVLQMHYTTNGQSQSDLTSFGVKYVPEESVSHEVYATAGIEQDFEIPPHAEDYGIEGFVDWFPKDGELLAITPHMHVRGKSFQLSALYDDREMALLDVPRYDFNWQHNYELSTPLPLNDVERLRFRSTFDNSAANPNNPDPSEYVTWGDQTWEEMSVVFLQVAKPRQPAARPSDAAARAERQAAVRAKAEAKAQATAEAQAFARDFLRRFDHNQDALVSRSEVPTAFRIYEFWRTDRDDDGMLDARELESAAARRSR
ncbi:redoxin domain-containing protein [Roseimaritima ulvae]|uniref:Thiol-disulfide oxidoreductase n=1 Tax=Roseimaritima ulvae TaxID=980254 RepID=A0A5B9QRV0_9BACT|nr:redoxin domain-containing protein [Roseimaritima ulvae]QEG41758.1 hypothetical protein UC8_37840 [Roseimaritima ulvae]